MDLFEADNPLKGWVDKLKSSTGAQGFMGASKPKGYVAPPTTQPQVVAVGGKMKPASSKPASGAPMPKDATKSTGPKKWVSAGGVIIKSKEQADKVYIVKPTNNYGPWAFPKGRVDAGESLRQAALREVFEETGMTAKIIDGGSSGYLGKGQGTMSVTHFFLMERTGGTPTPNEEMEEIKLVTWERAKAYFKSAGNKRDGAIADLAVAQLQAMGLKTDPK